MNYGFGKLMRYNFNANFKTLSTQILDAYSNSSEIKSTLVKNVDSPNILKYPGITSSTDSTSEMSVSSDSILSQLKSLQNSFNSEASDTAASEDVSSLKTKFEDVVDKWKSLQTALANLHKRRFVLAENLGLAEMAEYYLAMADNGFTNLSRDISAYSSVSSDSSSSISSLLKKLYDDIALYGDSVKNGESSSIISKYRADAFDVIENIRAILENYVNSARDNGEVVPSISHDSSGNVTVTRKNIISGEIKNIFLLPSKVSTSSLVGQTADMLITLHTANEITDLSNITESDLKSIYVSSCLLHINNVKFVETSQPVLIFWSKALYTATFEDPAPTEEGGKITSELYFNPHWFFGSDSRWATKDDGSMYIIRDKSNSVRFSGKYHIETATNKSSPFDYYDTITMDFASFDQNKPQALSDSISVNRVIKHGSTTAFTCTGTLDKVSSESGVSPLADPETGNQVYGYTIYHGSLTVKDATGSGSSSVNEEVYLRVKYNDGSPIYDIIADPEVTSNQAHMDDDLVPAAMSQSPANVGSTSISSRASGDSLADEDADAAYVSDLSKIIGIKDWTSAAFYLNSANYESSKQVVMSALTDMSIISGSKKSSIMSSISGISGVLSTFVNANSSLSTNDSGYDDSLVEDISNEISTAQGYIGNITSVDDMSVEDISSNSDIESAKSSVNKAEGLADSAIVSICSQIMDVSDIISRDGMLLCPDQSKYMTKSYTSGSTLVEALTGSTSDLKSIEYSGTKIYKMSFDSDEDYESWTKAFIEFTDGTKLDAYIAFMAYAILHHIPDRGDDEFTVMKDSIKSIGSYIVKDLIENKGLSNKLVSGRCIKIMEDERSLLKDHGLLVSRNINQSKLPYALVSSIPGSISLNSVDLEKTLSTLITSDSVSDYYDEVTDKMEEVWDSYISAISPDDVNDMIPKIVSSMKAASSTSMSPRSILFMAGLSESLKKFAMAAYETGSKYSPAYNAIFSLYGITDASEYASSSEITEAIASSSSYASTIKDVLSTYLNVWKFFYSFDTDGNIIVNDIVNGSNSALSGSFKDLVA